MSDNNLEWIVKWAKKPTSIFLVASLIFLVGMQVGMEYENTRCNNFILTNYGYGSWRNNNIINGGDGESPFVFNVTIK